MAEEEARVDMLVEGERGEDAGTAAEEGREAAAMMASKGQLVAD